MNLTLRFIHIPKTAGTSVFKFLSENNIKFFYGEEPKRVGRHRYASEWKDEVSYKFTVVRNPFARIVSYFNYIKTKEWNPSFEEFVKNKLINTKIKIPNGWIPQINWIYDDNVCLVDKIFKLEDNFEEEFKKFLNLESSNFPRENVSTINSYKEYYNDDLKEIVFGYFKKDFEFLNYNKEL